MVGLDPAVHRSPAQSRALFFLKLRKDVDGPTKSAMTKWGLCKSVAD